MNRKKSRNGVTCRFKGVHKARKGGWKAQIGFGGKAIYLGYHSTGEEAAAAYDAAAIRLHGEFARLNFQQQHRKQRTSHWFNKQTTTTATRN